MVPQLLKPSGASLKKPPGVADAARLFTCSDEEATLSFRVAQEAARRVRACSGPMPGLRAGPARTFVCVLIGQRRRSNSLKRVSIFSWS